MAIIKVKGVEFKEFNTKLSSFRKALQIKNNIVNTLNNAFNLTDDDVEVTIQKLPIRRVKAEFTWWMEGYKLYYSYSQGKNYADNLYIISKVIEGKAQEVIDGKLEMNDFCGLFREEEDVAQQRKDARSLLGVEETCNDLNIINKKYKLAAMKAHPDRPEGSEEKFKALNNAHKILKRELE